MKRLDRLFEAHPYMVSFLKVGFVNQTDAGQYELGPLALRLGLTKLQCMDPVKEASQLIEGLAHETGQSVAIAVWGNLGPTIVRMEEPGHVIDEYGDRAPFCGVYAGQSGRAIVRR